MTDDKTDMGQEDNHLIVERREKLAKLREAGNAFPNGFRRDSLAGDLQAIYGHFTKEELEEKQVVFSIAGRLMLDRDAFKVIQDMSGRIQVYATRAVQKQTRHWDLGDIVGVRGTLCKSGKGDLYVAMEEYQLLTKALRPLPEKHKGLTDTETRYRQRYLDLIANEHSRDVFRIRSQLVSALRRWLNEYGYMEVETPMLQVIPGGATARPFITHHNSLNMDMYLRIAPELYLKRLVVGGFDKVFEINRSFRNEGLSTRHNPEFTMVEFYQAYADYVDMMDFTEDMLRGLAREVLGSARLSWQGKLVDLGQPFHRLTVCEAIVAFNPDITASELNDHATLRKIAERLGIPLKDSQGSGAIQLEIFEKTVEHQLIEPTFITAYPTEVSPLARRNDSNPEITDRFELFIGGREIANGFSELNDAEDQAERFRKQVAEKEDGNDEAMFYDEDYITALEYGMPPTAGEGIGIDRLVMLFTDSASIRDVILFPHMRPADR